VFARFLQRFERVLGCAAVPLSRIAWLLTVAAALITALLLLISDYNGYALLAVAVGASAAINLR
jgi:hypothetical protein